MGTYVWIGFLMMVALIGFFYMPLDQAQNEIVNATNSTVSHAGAQQTMNYLSTIWYFFPVLVLIMFGYWALNQAQRRSP